MTEREQLNEERERLLEQIEGILEGPLIVLGFAWLALVVVDLVWGLCSLLQGQMNLIWIGRDADNPEAEVAGAKELIALHKEVATLRAEMRTLLDRTAYAESGHA